MNGILINIKNNIIAMLLWCSLILFVISIAIFITLNFSWIMFALSHTSISGTTHANRVRDYGRLILYLQWPFDKNLVFKYIPMSASGTHHFEDVKSLFAINEVAIILFGMVSIPWLWGKKKKQQLWQLMLPIKGWGIFFPTVSTLLVVNFNNLFIKFHEIVFSNQDWVFDPRTDPIINVLTENFFIVCVLVFLVLVEIELGILYFCGYWQLKNSIRHQ